MSRRLAAAVLAALLLIGAAPAATAAPAPRIVDIGRTVQGIAAGGIPPRPAALRPRRTPTQGPPVAVQVPAAELPDIAAGDPQVPADATEGPAALPVDVAVAQVSGVETGNVVAIPAPQPAAAAQAPGLAGVVQLGADAISMDDVARVALDAGFVGEDLVRAVAVAYAESRNDPNAVGTNTDGSRDYGLWQINSVHSPPVPAIFNPEVNANYAYSIFAQRDFTWFPWYAYYNPFTGERRSDQYMAQARAAVQRLLGSGATATPSGPGVPAAEAPSPTALALDGEPCRASWMGEDLLGAPTASGDPFDPEAFTAAMYTVPLGSVWTVTNSTTGASVEVVVNDRGPDRSTGRCIDLSAAAFSTIAGPADGTVEVTVAPA